MAPRFLPAAVLEKPVIDDLLDQFAVTGASPALARAMESARAGRFADLLVADTVPGNELGTRAALSGLALLSLANPAAVVEFQRALQLQAPAAAVQFLMGAARAVGGRDLEAIAAWDAARQAGFPRPIIDRLVAEAYLRQKDFVRAAAAIGDRPSDTASMATFAATRIAMRRSAEAIPVIDSLLGERPDDAQARWLLLHALYAQFVGGDRSAGARLRAEALRYIDAKGPACPAGVRVGEGSYFFLSGGGAGGLPSVLSEYARREWTVTPGRSTFTSSWRVRLLGSGFVE